MICLSGANTMEINNWIGDCDVDSHGIRQPTHVPSYELREDVIWSNVDTSDDGEDELTLAPLDPETEAARRQIREADWPAPVIEIVEEPPRYQFSLRHMLIANTALAIIFALMQALAPSLLAGVLGITALVTAILVAVYQPDQRSLHVAWWGLLALYLIASVVAVIRG